jgi:hypothetical protein
MRTGRRFSSANATELEKSRTVRKPFIHALSMTNEFYAGKPRACCILLTLFRDEQNEREEEAPRPTCRRVRIGRWLERPNDASPASHICILDDAHCTIPALANKTPDLRQRQSASELWATLRPMNTKSRADPNFTETGFFQAPFDSSPQRIRMRFSIRPNRKRSSSRPNRIVNNMMAMTWDTSFNSRPM